MQALGRAPMPDMGPLATLDTIKSTDEWASMQLETEEPKSPLAVKGSEMNSTTGVSENGEVPSIPVAEHGFPMIYMVGSSAICSSSAI